jgi:hypothetical protein
MSPALLQNLLRFRLSRLIYLSTRRPPRALAVSVIAVLSAQQSRNDENYDVLADGLAKLASTAFNR